MTPVIIESPLRGEDGDYQAAELYLNYCIRDCLRLGETPYASHRMFPGALDDTKLEQRALGISAGLKMSIAIVANCPGARAAFYEDIGFSEGMENALAHYLEAFSESRTQLPLRKLLPEDLEAYEQELRELRAA